jgi:predicted P-loop ATPase
VTRAGEASEPRRTLAISIRVDSDDELRALRGALLAARASELSEVQRRAQRHNLGYGSDTARESMSDEVANLRRRWEMLDRLISSLDEARSGDPT